MASHEPLSGLIVFTDGRSFYMGLRAVIMVNDRPVSVDAVRPGTPITVSGVTRSPPATGVPCS
ncbi:MAG TPA: hypothetical protein VLF19_12985 [Methylomirabilota bacterium]|nr:hypothetical protein [Methylomirabilota bacterium]